MQGSHGARLVLEDAKVAELVRVVVPSTGVRFQVSSFRVWASGCRVQGSGCMVQGAGCGLQGAGCRVQGSGCRVQGAGLRVESSSHRACSCCRTWSVKVDAPLEARKGRNFKI